MSFQKQLISRAAEALGLGTDQKRNKPERKVSRKSVNVDERVGVELREFRTGNSGQ